MNKDSNYYGVEIVGKEAYTESLGSDDLQSTAYGKERNDFEGTKEACLAYIEKKGVSKIYGALSDESAKESK